MVSNHLLSGMALQEGTLQPCRQKLVGATSERTAPTTMHSTQGSDKKHHLQEHKNTAPQTQPHHHHKNTTAPPQQEASYGDWAHDLPLTEREWCQLS